MQFLSDGDEIPVALETLLRQNQIIPNNMYMNSLFIMARNTSLDIAGYCLVAQLDDVTQVVKSIQVPFSEIDEFRICRQIGTVQCPTFLSMRDFFRSRCCKIVLYYAHAINAMKMLGYD